MTMMKRLARNYVWWPGFDSDVESVVKGCESCQMNQRLPKKSLPHPWIRPQGPWERIHVDFAGPFKGSMWMVVADAYSKWLEVVNMRSNTKSDKVIRELRILFRRFGLPKILVSDNGPQLISGEFEQFCTSNGINHVPIPSYHPASNGQAESVVGKFKRAMAKMASSNSDMELNISNWLLHYHNTPHSTTGVEPSILMLGRRVRSALSLFHPLSTSQSLKRQVHDEQMIIDNERNLRRFSVGDHVLYRNVLKNSWHRGVVKDVSDKLYIITAENGSTVRKHLDHVVVSTSVPAGQSIPSPSVESGEGDETAGRRPLPVVDQQAQPMQNHNQSTQPIMQNQQSTQPIMQMPESTNNSFSQDSNISQDCSTSTDAARPKRVSKPPERLAYRKLGGE